MPTNAEAIVSTLKKAGVEFAFGLPGGEVTALIQACKRAGIRFLLTGHEASAAFMADVTGQITQRPGVCIATLGPGAMNLCLGVANAFLDRSPVLALTATIPPAIADHYSHQRLPLTQVFGGICKGSATVDGHGTVALVESALRLAATPPCGPVHLALASDLAGQDVGAGESSVDFRVPPPPLSSAALDDILAMLRESRRPLLMAGVGCLAHDVPALRRFIDRTGMPYAVTPKAKGVLPEAAPGFLGVIGGMAIDREIMKAVDAADLLVGAGFDPVECDSPWYASRNIANLSRAPTREGRYAPVEHIGEIGDALMVLAERAPRGAWPEEILAAHRAGLRVPPIRSAEALSPLEAVRAMREVLPDETILASDVGSHKYYAGQFWRCDRPQTFFMSNGLSGMGYGVPAAIAAKLHFPDAPAVALVGDGGLLMMLHNLNFLRQYRVPVVIVCFVDESLSLIRISQQRRGFEPYGTDFPAPDFARAAEAFGVKGVRVDSLDGLKQELAAAVRSGLPALLQVPVNIGEYQAYV